MTTTDHEVTQPTQPGLIAFASALITTLDALEQAREATRRELRTLLAGHLPLLDVYDLERACGLREPKER